MKTRTLEQIIPSIATSDGGGVKLRRSLGQNQTLCSGLIKTDTLNRLINLNQLKQGPSKNETKTPSIR